MKTRDWIRRSRFSYHRLLEPARRHGSFRTYRIHDGEQFEHTMPASMTLGDDAKTFLDDIGGEFLVAHEGAERPLHPRAVADAQPGVTRKQLFDILPRSGNHGDAAGHRLEHPDSRNAGQRPRIGRAGHMHGNARTGKRGRHAMSGQPAAIFEACCLDRPYRIERVSYAVDPRPQRKLGSGVEQEFLELGAALAISPLAEPDQ